MSQDPKHIQRSLRLLADQRAQKQAELAAFEAKCRQRLPQLGQLDSAIRATVSRAIASALQSGGDATQAVERARRENLALQDQRLALLATAGIDAELLEDRPLCPVCNDTRYHDGRLCACVTRRCAQENLAELSRQLAPETYDFDRFSLSWYDPGYDGRLGDSPRELMGAVLSLCRDYAEGFPDQSARNLYLYGGTGLGKTLLSGCMARTVAGRGYWTVYTTAGALFAQYEAVKFGRDPSGAAAEDVRRFEGCDLLVLDDLGSEMTTPFVQSALYQLLNQRILEGRHTVISSNLDMDAVRERYTPQVASRLEGEFQELPFVGRDIRLQRKEER